MKLLLIYRKYTNQYSIFNKNSIQHNPIRHKNSKIHISCDTLTTSNSPLIKSNLTVMNNQKIKTNLQFHSNKNSLERNHRI